MLPTDRYTDRLLKPGLHSESGIVCSPALGIPCDSFPQIGSVSCLSGLHTSSYITPAGAEEWLIGALYPSLCLGSTLPRNNMAAALNFEFHHTYPPYFI